MNNNNNDNNNNNNNDPMEIMEYLILSMECMEHIVNPDVDDPYELTENNYLRACDFMRFLSNNKNLIKRQKIAIPRVVPPQIRAVITEYWKNNRTLSYAEHNKKQAKKRYVCMKCGQPGLHDLTTHQGTFKCNNSYAKKKAILWVKNNDIAGWDKTGENHPYIQSFQHIHSKLWDYCRQSRRQRYRDALDDEWVKYEQTNGIIRLVITNAKHDRGKKIVFKEWGDEYKEKWRNNRLKNTINAYYEKKALIKHQQERNRRRYESTAQRIVKGIKNIKLNRYIKDKERKKRKRDYQIIKKSIKAYLKSKYKRVWYEYADKDTPSYANSRTLKVKGKGEEFYLTAYN